jgi:hypothetical protein
LIIKCKQVRARGPVLTRLITHIEDADDNEEVVALRGHFADILDARTDARQFGREYAAVHWIISPARFATDEKMLEAVDRLGVEFGFDAARAVVRIHQKSKADAKSKAAGAALFDRHVHVLAPAVDPTGGVMSLSHSFARNEKLGRTLEYDWGGWADPLTRDETLEPFTRGVHLKAVIATLERSDRKDVAAALKAAFPDDQPRPVQSFDTAAQQRLKRKGLDLPALRILIKDAWNSAADRSEFEMNLSESALVARAGDKPGVVVIETPDGHNVGSLARLIKITKSDVKAKMEKQDAGPEKWDEDTTHDASEANLGGSGIQEHAADQLGSGASEGAGATGAGHASGRANRDVDRGEPAVGRSRPADVGEVGPHHRIAGGSGDREGPSGYDERVIASNDFALALGLAAHAPALTGILGLATRNALSQNERVAVELGEIEEDARIARAMIDTHPDEPASLIKARDAVSEAQRKVESAQSVADDAVAASTSLQRPRPWWRRTIGLFTGENAQHAARIQAATLAERKAQSALSQARNDRLSEQNRLALTLQHHKEAVKEHIEKWTERAKAAEAKAVVTARAREILQRLPGAAALGPAGLHRLGAKFPKQKRNRRNGPRPEGEATFSTPF